MPWYHYIAALLTYNLPRMRATRRTNLALLTAAIRNRRTLALSELARPWMPGLPQSHRQRKKRCFRFLSNPRFDPIQTQCDLMPAICQLAGIKGLTPIMIDWSDLGRQRNGLFAAVCGRKRGLPLLSRATAAAALNPSQNRREATFLGCLLQHRPDTVRPLVAGRPGLGTRQLAAVVARNAPPHWPASGLCSAAQGQCPHPNRRRISGFAAAISFVFWPLGVSARCKLSL